VDMAPSIWAQVPDLVKRPLVAGDLIPVPIWRRTELRNDSREPANLLVLTVGFTTRGTPRLDPAYPQGQSTTYAGQKSQSWWAGAQVRADGEATVTSLAGNMKTMLPANGGNVAIAKATLAPGSAIAFDELNGPYLIAGNAGAFVLSTAVRDLDELHVFRHLDGGQGAHLDPGTVASISNVEEEQVVVTIVAILPAEA
jgi:hypothetical protein